MKERYYCETLKSDVRQYCAECETCQRTKGGKRKRKVAITTMPIPKRPWESIAIDFLTGLPNCPEDEHNGILVAVCRLSGFCLLIPCIGKEGKTTSVETANLLFDRSIGMLGVPSSIYSDRDTRFTSAFWQAYTRRLGIQQCMGTGHHHNTGGSAEKKIRDVVPTTRAVLHELKLPIESWKQVLPCVEFALNNRKGSTGRSPAELVFIYPPRDLFDAIRAHPSEVPDADQRIEEMRKVISETISKLQCIKDANNKRASPAKGKRLVCYLRLITSEKRIEKGDLVFVNAAYLPKRKWIG